jgi:hypothetical protein
LLLRDGLLRLVGGDRGLLQILVLLLLLLLQCLQLLVELVHLLLQGL